jgi:hypothetical protein
VSAAAKQPAQRQVYPSAKPTECARLKSCRAVFSLADAGGDWTTPLPGFPNWPLCGFCCLVGRSAGHNIQKIGSLVKSAALRHVEPQKEENQELNMLPLNVLISYHDISGRNHQVSFNLRIHLVAMTTQQDSPMTFEGYIESEKLAE